ncbi:MAG TPA: phospholipase [Caulobacteraceae bacterium]|jgi:phospholipase/carboxylesterase|nr:phospholipase [Caulobacteraceae bacterium]
MFGLDGPRVPPRSGKPAKLVILAHGYGSNGQDLIGLAPYFAKAVPDAVFVSPDAPEPVPGYPGGCQWFPLARLDPVTTAAGVRGAGPVLDRFIDAELLRYGLPASACALVGFSQGTMMALHVGLRRKQPLGAVLGYSGMLAAVEALPREIASRPPVCLVHGDRDDVIPPQALFMTAEGLAAAGTPALWRLCKGAGHTITEDALLLGGQFLRSAFAGRYRDWASPVRKPA